MFTRIKSYIANDAFFYGLLLLAVGVGSFGLGRLSVVSIAPPADSARVILTESPRELRSSNTQAANVAATADEATMLVASRNGTKYHYLWCPGAQQMKEENKVFFANSTEARAAGYEPAANCTGLE